MIRREIPPDVKTQEMGDKNKKSKKPKKLKRKITAIFAISTRERSKIEVNKKWQYYDRRGKERCRINSEMKGL